MHACIQLSTTANNTRTTHNKIDGVQYECSGIIRKFARHSYRMYSFMGEN